MASVQPRRRISATSALLALVGTCAAIVIGVATASPPVRAVDRFEAERYAGTWFEIARLPNRLQSHCASDATATYRVLDDGSLNVIHRCRDASRRVSAAIGHALPVPGHGARLKLSYLPDWLRWWPASRKDHWVVMLDEQYRYAVVSDPERRSLWVLSRTPTLEPGVYDDILQRLRVQRFPVEQLVRTPQKLAEDHRPDLAGRGRPRLMV